MIMRLIACIISIFGGPILFAKEDLAMSTTGIHVVGTEEWRCSFVAKPLSGNERFYAIGGLAIEIVKVKVDGAVLEPEVSDSIITFDWSEFSAKTDLIQYTMDIRDLHSALRDSGGVIGVGYNQYHIPPEAKKVEIYYKIHFPDETNSGLCLLTSFDAKEMRRQFIQSRKHKLRE